MQWIDLWFLAVGREGNGMVMLMRVQTYFGRTTEPQWWPMRIECGQAEILQSEKGDGMNEKLSSGYTLSVTD